MILQLKDIKCRLAFAGCCLLLISSVITGCQQQADPAILAEIAEEKITKADFLPRFRDFILTSGSDDSPRVRDQILNNMVNEHLLAAYSDQLKLTDTPHFELRADRHRRKAVLNAYRRQMIDNQIDVSESEVRDEFTRFNERLRARHLFAPDRETADSIYALLESGETFQNLARQTFSDPLLASTGGDLGFFGIGDMDPAFEDAAYGTATGHYSKPIETDYGYSIIKIEDRRKMPLATETRFATQRKQIHRYLKWKKTVLYERAFLSKKIQSANISYHAEGLRKLSGIIQSAVNGNAADSIAFQANMELSADISGLPCISSKAVNWTLGATLQQLGELQLGQVKRGQTLVGLKNILRGLVARELMLGDALAKGVDKQDRVKRDSEAAIRLEKVRALQLAVNDSVSLPAQAIRAHYLKLKDQYYFPDKANVQLLMVRDSLRAKTIAGQLQKGTNFTSLIMRWSQWPDSDAHQGRLGWVPRGKFGEWSDDIFAAQKGEVLGPRKIEDGWFFVRLLDIEPRKAMSLEEATPQISATLLALQQKSAFTELINRLRSQASWTIYTELVNELSLI